jgi:hypothetical protein
MYIFCPDDLGLTRRPPPLSVLCTSTFLDRHMQINCCALDAFVNRSTPGMHGASGKVECKRDGMAINTAIPQLPSPGSCKDLDSQTSQNNYANPLSTSCIFPGPFVRVMFLSMRRS